MGDGADHLTEMYDGDLFSEEDLLEGAARTREDMKSLYVKAKGIPAGHSARCPGCGKAFRKKVKQQAFCRSKGRGNCKDRYWNTVDQDRSIKAGGARLW